MEPSSPDQAAFHEGFADVVALLSVFSIPEVVKYAVSHATPRRSAQTVDVARLTIEALQEGVLLGLGEQFGEGLSGVHGSALRRSVKLKPSKTLKDTPDYLRGAHARRVARRLGAARVPVGIPRPPGDARTRLRRPAAR